MWSLFVVKGLFISAGSLKHLQQTVGCAHYRQVVLRGHFNLVEWDKDWCLFLQFTWPHLHFGSPGFWPLNFVVCMPTLSTKGNALLWNGIMILEFDLFPIFILFLFISFNVACGWLSLSSVGLSSTTVIRRLVTFYEKKTLKKKNLGWKELRGVICPSPVAVNKCAWNTLQDFSTRWCFLL